jgi:polyvinyl alcohol dehydrogenase (cytochrome)
VVGDTLFYPAGQANHVVALDTKTGCVKWATATPSGIRNSLAYGKLGANGPMGLVGGAGDGKLVALDAKTGKVVWSVDPRHDKQVPLSGSPLFMGERIIVPISAADVSLAMRPNHQCCKSHGAVAAVDAGTGKLLWTWRTMEEAKPLGRKNASGVEMYGPSGAPIWSSPAVDLKRNVVYVSTGENTSPPGTKTSDAIVAIDAKTGKEKWVFQALENDIWHMACPIGPPKPGQTVHPNCFFAGEGSILLDHDFGAGPLIHRGRGRELILAGQKSGDVWAIDAATGKQVWRQKFGEGSALGGVHWGITTDGTRVFAPISDPNIPANKSAAGMHAVDIATGKVAWQWRAKPDCDNGRKSRAPICETKYGLSAAPLVIDGALLSGSLDGKLYVFDAATGKVMATHDVTGPHQAVNKIPATGGSIDAAGVFAGDGMVFVNAGYGSFGQIPGNTLVALRPKR